MIREIAIYFYLLFVKITFNICKMFKIKRKIVFVVSFGDNTNYIYQEIVKSKMDYDIVILYKGKSGDLFRDYPKLKLIDFEGKNIFNIVKSFYHLATAQFIFVDNYFGFLASITFKPNVECIQLWHASGAIKKFGLEDQTIQFRSKKALERFQRVYNNFHRVIVGSEIMADIFVKSFNIPKERILRTGIPRTDFYYDNMAHEHIIQKYKSKNPNIFGKKKILYAPTFRDNELNEFQLKIDLNLFYEQLGDGYVLLLRVHPAVKVKENYAKMYPGFVYDYSSSMYDINELLLISDYLITDYSSIPYEYSLLKRPMIFFAYDLEQYKKERGLVDDYEQMVPGPIVKTTEELVKAIKEKSEDPTKLANYANKWNAYSQGSSSRNIVMYMLKKENEKERQYSH